MKTNPASSTLHIENYLAQYAKAENTFSPALRELKLNAKTSFETLGFPTTKNEEWKYTNVAGMLGNNFMAATEELLLTHDDIKSFLPEEEKSIVLVFENGKFHTALSQLSALPDGIIAGNLYDFQDHHVVQKYLGKIALHRNESFVALNTALFRQGAFIYADKNLVSEKTIHLLFINDARKFATVSYPRNLVVAASGSSLKISESYYSVNAVNPSFCNPVSEIYIDDNASVEFCKIESENLNDFHIDYTGAFLKKDSKLNIHTITTGGKITRNNLRIELQNTNASAFLNGLYVLSGESHVDNHSFVDHASPGCYSNEFYKGVLDGKSLGVFNGKIFVRKDAQKTNAYQSNKNILLSDDASMNAKPQLEIYADDVKCSHGATTGQLDREALFYLRSRGIGKEEAQALLTTAFAEEILDKVSTESIREKLKRIIHSKLMKGNE